MTTIDEEMTRFGNAGALAGAFDGETPDAKAAATVLAEALRTTALGPSYSLRVDLEAARREVRDADRALADFKKSQATAPVTAPATGGALRRWAARIVPRVRPADRSAEELRRKPNRLDERALRAKQRLTDIEASVKADEERAKEEEERIAHAMDAAKGDFERALTSEFNAWRTRSKRIRDRKEER